LIEVDISIETKRTPQHDTKSKNVSQDDEQHNAALRRQNHKKKKNKCKM